MPTIDLNADVGEECGDDAALFAVVTTASVAAGGHAGGGPVLDQTVALAVAAGVAVGAHPSYPDRSGFGRVSHAHVHGPRGIAAFVRDQTRNVARACARHGVPVAHVKAHGALYSDIARDRVLASAFLDGVAGADTGSPVAVMGPPGSDLAGICQERGVTFLAEAFADRAYLPDGSLVPRRESGAVIHDPSVVAERAVRLAVDGVITAIDGTVVPVPAVTVCLHGDTPGAVALARQVRASLERSGVRIAAAGPPR